MMKMFLGSRPAEIFYNLPPPPATIKNSCRLKLLSLMTVLSITQIVFTLLSMFALALPVSARSPITATPAETAPDDEALKPETNTKKLGVASPISPAYLRQSTKEIRNPNLVIQHYNRAQGLLAAYQSDAGKRIIFEAKFRTSGSMTAQVLHLDPDTYKIVPIVGRSMQPDETGAPAKDISVGGVDIRTFLKNSSTKTNGHAEKEAQLKSFIANETGQALYEALPALYAKLEELEQVSAFDPEVAKLKTPFGAIVMAMQISTKQFTGFKHAEKVMGNDKAQALRDSCGTANDCMMRGKSYMIHSSGLFDVVSKHKGAPADKGTQKEKADSESSEKSATESSPTFLLKKPSNSNFLQQVTQSTKVPRIASVSQNGNGICDNPGPCFGGCGPGCVTPGEIYTPQCLGHDYCVCAYSHAECLVSVPDGCGVSEGYSCSSLFDATVSYLGGLWDSFLDWIDSWFDNNDPCKDSSICQNG